MTDEGPRKIQNINSPTCSPAVKWPHTSPNSLTKGEGSKFLHTLCHYPPTSLVKPYETPMVTGTQTLWRKSGMLTERCSGSRAG